MSLITSTCPSQSFPAPIPMVGMLTDFVISCASLSGIHSSVMAKTPAFSNNLASSNNLFALCSSLPCTLNPPKAFTDCGVNPICPITGICASTMAFIVSVKRAPPSIFTASAPPSLIILPAFRTASSFEIWYDKKGMSATINAFFTPRTTVFV
ncbi:hypothetical protein SDC9_92009 [bioreactor metagenome]|uniref:Uncharacterized protein n=1 Tax=bioreactor metagenome TaxID=1076179 RepID=A0A645A389_9ZZZZ